MRPSGRQSGRRFRISSHLSFLLGLVIRRLVDQKTRHHTTGARHSPAILQMAPNYMPYTSLGESQPIWTCIARKKHGATVAMSNTEYTLALH